MFKKGQSPAYYGSFYRRKASLSGDCSFLCVKWLSRDLGWIPLYTISVKRDFTVSFKKEWLDGSSCPVFDFCPFKRSAEFL